VLSSRGLCERPIPRPESPTDCVVSLCAIRKPQESNGPGPRCAVAPQRGMKAAGGIRKIRNFIISEYSILKNRQKMV
jgi:hypothetical protein